MARSKPGYREDAEQKAIFEWAALHRVPDPPDPEKPFLIDYLFAIPNGGNRNPREAARLKAQGVKAGVSDMFLPIARGGYHGMWIELKATPPADARVSRSQADWIALTRVCGYRAMVCKGMNAAMMEIGNYLLNRSAENSSSG